MEPEDFRNLNVQLPRQPLVNQRPWWIAGLLLAIVILLLAVWSYITHKKRAALEQRYGKTASNMIDPAKGIKCFTML